MKNRAFSMFTLISAVLLLTGSTGFCRTALEVLIPTGDVQVTVAQMPKRLGTLSGKTIAFFWNTKANGDIFFDEVASILKEKHGAKVVTFYPGKGDATKQAPAKAIDQVVRTKPDLIINGPCD